MNEHGQLFVKNPHSILAALQSRPKDVVEIIFPKDITDGVWAAISAQADQNKIRKQEARGDGGNFAAPAPRKDSKRNPAKGPITPKASKTFLGRDSAHGALIRPKVPTSVERLFDGIDQDTRGVWLALDSLQDPQNLGAIFRSAAFFGVKGIILTTERSAPMSATVYDISAGGVEAIPYVPVINLQRAFEKAKDAGLWILGTSEHSKTPLSQIQKDRPWLLVVGNEENGMRRLTEEACDMTCAIPAQSPVVTSLNVSVATGILLSHL